jgi:hypothetical protein
VKLEIGPSSLTVSPLPGYQNLKHSLLHLHMEEEGKDHGECQSIPAPQFLPVAAERVSAARALPCETPGLFCRIATCLPREAPTLRSGHY